MKLFSMMTLLASLRIKQYQESLFLDYDLFFQFLIGEEVTTLKVLRVI
jgi:hypothetical protein